MTTLDTKGEEAGYLKEQIELGGYNVLMIDVGLRGSPPFSPDISKEEVARAAGAVIEDISLMGERAEEHEAGRIMGAGARKIVQGLHSAGKLDGIISLGGSMGTNLCASIMKSLPFGMPKLMVSTVASGDTRPYIGTRDIIMFPSIADIIGLNRITEAVLTNAAGAIIGMVSQNKPKPSERALITATNLGGTTASCIRAKEALEEMGYEVVVFHAFSGGGTAMEEMIEQGLIAGVFDLSINEVTGNVCGGLADAGPARMEAAGRKGIPQVVAPGNVEHVFFNPWSLPERFQGRDMFCHTPVISALRLTKSEQLEMAKVIAEKLNKAKGPTAVIIPKQGFSLLDKEGVTIKGGASFYDPEANEAFTELLKRNLKPEIVFEVVDAHITDEEFSLAAAALLHQLMQETIRK